MLCKQCGSHELTQISPEVYQCQRCMSQTRAEMKTTHDSEKAVKAIEVNKIDFKELESAIVRLQSDAGTGTGFFIHPEGYVLTNAHVIKDAEIIQGYIGSSPVLHEFELYANGEVIDLDLAVLKLIDDAPFKPLRLSKDRPQLADTLIAIGNPKNLGISVSKGALSRTTEKEYQLDLTVNPGNSGGPVLNEKGEVVGVISYLLQEVQGIGFAINLDMIKSFLKLSFNPKGEGNEHV